MARRCCRLRRVLICLCAPCCCMVFLYLYLAVMITLNMHNIVPQQTIPSTQNPYFVATGTLRNGRLFLVPKSFWEEHLLLDGLWNKLQRSTDNHFNPILYPVKAKNVSKRNNFGDFLLKQAYTKVTRMQKMKDNSERLPKEIQSFINNMHKRDYPILIQPKGVCGAQTNDEQEPALILMAIKTTEQNFKNRQAIRKTWGRAGWVMGQRINSSDEELRGGYIRRVFLLGKESADDLDMDASQILKTENELHGDILQWDFKDTFFNLTLKDVLFWSWFSHHCGQTLFILKGDDDVFVNTPKLVTYLHHQLNKSQVKNNLHDFMVGDVIDAALPNRDKKSKYFIPDSFYMGLYPMYAGGGGVVYSGLLAQRLYNISKMVHLFPIDDVYVGMCIKRLNTHPLHHSAFLTFDFWEEEKSCSYHSVLLVHKRNPEQLVKLWADMKEMQTQCKDVPLVAPEKKLT